MQSEPYIIISYKHTSGGHLCFWRKNCAGYTENLKEAGMYSEREVNEQKDYFNKVEDGEIHTYAIKLLEFKNLFKDKMRTLVTSNQVIREQHLKELLNR